MSESAPTYDLDFSDLPLTQIEQLFFRWAHHAICELAPKALDEFSHQAEAEELRNELPSLERATARSAFDICRAIHQRVWKDITPNSDRERAFYVLGHCENVASAAAELVGAIHTVQGLSEHGQITEVIPWTDEELEEQARRRPEIAAAAARSISHVVGGQTGFAAEVLAQHQELRRLGWPTKWEALEWGALCCGERYRVYTEFSDRDGLIHPWGESWTFEKCVFDPEECRVQLIVSDAWLLSSSTEERLRRLPVEEIQIAWDVGNKPVRPKDQFFRCITDYV